MINIETLSDGRIYTYSDTYKIRQIDTGVVYNDAVDSVPHEYEETDELLPQEEISSDEVLKILQGVD